jgi:hypothetical protein
MSIPTLLSKEDPANHHTVKATKDDDPADKNENEKELHIALCPYLLDYSKRKLRNVFSILSTKLVLWTNMVVDEMVVERTISWPLTST